LGETSKTLFTLVGGATGAAVLVVIKHFVSDVSGDDVNEDDVVSFGIVD
jgi:hypothetical protein